MSEFLARHWFEIAALLVAAWSEFMALHPKWQSNGIVQFLTIVARKFTERKP